MDPFHSSYFDDKLGVVERISNLAWNGLFYQYVQSCSPVEEASFYMFPKIEEANIGLYRGIHRPCAGISACFSLTIVIGYLH